MTCHFMGGAIICTADTFVNLEPYGAKIWVEYHSYTGPAFFRSQNSNKEILTPSRKTWDAFYRWFEEYDKVKGKGK